MVFEKSSAVAVRGVSRVALSPRKAARSDWMPTRNTRSNSLPQVSAGEAIDLVIAVLKTWVYCAQLMSSSSINARPHDPQSPVWRISNSWLEASLLP